MNTPIFDGLWRAEPHPHRAGEFLIARYSNESGRPTREVATEGDKAKVPRKFTDEEKADKAARAMNPKREKIDTEGRFGMADIQWLKRLKEAGEDGVMERSVHRILNGLEHRSLATSRTQEGYRGMDRWHITKQGEKKLAEFE